MDWSAWVKFWLPILSLTSVDLDLNHINDVWIAELQRLSIFFGFMHKDAVAPHLSAVLMVKSTLTVLALAGDKNGWHLSDALEYQPHTHEAEPGGHPDPEMLELTRLSGGDQVSIPRLNSFYLGSMNRGEPYGWVKRWWSIPHFSNQTWPFLYPFHRMWREILLRKGIQEPIWKKYYYPSNHQQWSSTSPFSRVPRWPHLNQAS